MVNTEIPKNYTASPSSLCGTPQLTINHDAAFNLDSSNLFEGPEKLLEVWFAPSADALPTSAKRNGLKCVPSASWTGMLDLVHCKVLSVIESDHVDAYLLSESSMFVFPHKLVLKTCGITTLLYGIPRMLEIAALSAGFPHTPAQLEKNLPATAATYRVFYSRKNYLYPEQQRGPHRSWRDEVRALDRLFRGGSAYMIGKMNGEHWYLYITDPDTRFTPPSTPEHEKEDYKETDIHALDFAENMTLKQIACVDTEDETLEILMTDLDEENSKQFYLEHAATLAEDRFWQDSQRAKKQSRDARGMICEEINIRHDDDDTFDVFAQTSSDHAEICSNEAWPVPAELANEGHALGTVISEASGLSDVYPTSKYPDAKIDAYLFTPCGFSANGVIPASNGSHGKGRASSLTHYFTVHVTPEPQCSYASFETNVPTHQTGRETAEVVEQVVNIFRPARFSVTLFEAKPNNAGYRSASVEKKSLRMDGISGYRTVDRIVHDLDGYDLVFRHYERHDWRGGAPRLGEVY